MMRIIVITDTSFAASEAESIRILLLEGADRVHLRKPQSPDRGAAAGAISSSDFAGSFAAGRGVRHRRSAPERPQPGDSRRIRGPDKPLVPLVRRDRIASDGRLPFSQPDLRQHLQNRLPSGVCTGRTPKGIRAGHHQSARRSARRHPAGTPARVKGVRIRRSCLSRVHLAGRYARRTGAAYAGNTKIQPINRRKTVRKSV